MSAVLDLLRTERAKLMAELATLDDAIGVIEGRLTAREPEQEPRAVFSKPHVTYADSIRKTVIEALEVLGEATAEEVAAVVDSATPAQVQRALWAVSQHGTPLVRTPHKGGPSTFRLAGS